MLQWIAVAPYQPHSKKGQLLILIKSLPNLQKFVEISQKIVGFWPRSEDLFLFGRSPLDTKFVDRKEDGSKLYLFILVRGKRDKRLRIAGRVVTLRNKKPSDCF